MRKLGALLSLTAIFHLSACAQGPESISPTYVGDIGYHQRSCDELTEENAALNSRLDEVSGNQRENAMADFVTLSVGLLVFWPALFLLAATKDHKDDIARMKGERDAIQRVSARKQCSAARLEPATYRPGIDQGAVLPAH